MAVEITELVREAKTTELSELIPICILVKCD
jgi:hypothetical protein